MQRQGESIDAYYVRLKMLAKDCEFGEKLDNEIKLQIISTCSDKRIKYKAAQETIELKDLLKFAQALEYGSEAIGNNTLTKKEVGSTKVESAYQIRTKQVKRGSKSSNQKCYKCGYDYPHQASCPAKEKEC